MGLFFSEKFSNLIRKESSILKGFFGSKFIIIIILVGERLLVLPWKMDSKDALNISLTGAASFYEGPLVGSTYKIDNSEHVI